MFSPSRSPLPLPWPSHPSGSSQCTRPDNPICKTEKEIQMYRTGFWTLWEKARVGCSERIALKQVYYQGWNRSPTQVGCMILILYPCFHISSSSFSSVQSLSCVGLQHTRLLCPSPTSGVYSNSCSLSRGCHPTTSSSVISFSSHIQSFPASGSFPRSQFFSSGGQSIGVSASASVLPVNIQIYFL